MSELKMQIFKREPQEACVKTQERRGKIFLKNNNNNIKAEKSENHHVVVADARAQCCYGEQSPVWSEGFVGPPTDYKIIITVTDCVERQWKVCACFCTCSVSGTGNISLL